ncbi:MAG: restriction endonuclease [Bacteroidales bacterium]|nr:restriction endonuclease [Bacteroidales bacterium]MCF8403376.1 restriction endonuclease [Bacteroidales bacterium]
MNLDKAPVLITKRNGERVSFDVQKLIDSLDRSGASQEEIEKVINEVGNNLVEGMTTHKVYKMAYAILRKKSHRIAGKYRLKKAIFELGPTGYPFERFVGELLKNQGYQVEVGKIIQGHCVQHEVDVIAEKDDRKYMIECKFHSEPSRKCDVKVSLYIHSRFLDVEKEWKKNETEHLRFHQGWIVTNTRFTADATQFGKCAGLNLISWDYPAGSSLRERIDHSGLHPITALQSLNTKEKQALLQLEVVLCRSLSADILRKIDIDDRKINKILKEVAELTQMD